MATLLQEQMRGFTMCGFTSGSPRCKLVRHRLGGILAHSAKTLTTHPDAHQEQQNDDNGPYV